MSLVESWESEIRRDLTPFIDPGTSIVLSANGDVIDALWTQKRREVVAKFTVRGPEGVTVNFGGRELSYRSFLALDEMGDVLGIAQTTASVFPKEIYVDTRAEEAEGKVAPAISLIQGLVEGRDPSIALTPFIMVTGEAGAGKTSLLKELVRRQAVEYAAGRASYVFLYVNAQGRALARFHEALATELNELRVAVPYHAVAVLARHNLIIPVVDGFDELLGAGGYDEAFASIWSFIQELDGKGAMVTSARSTYYEQEFLSRSERVNAEDRGGWQLEGISLLGWSDLERSEYIDKFVAANGGDSAHIALEMNKVFAGENHSLSDKPLFVSRAIKVIASGGIISGPGSLISKLADEFISREISEKLITKDGSPILSHSQMRELCSDFAEEMWNLGTRELDRLTVAELSEIAMAGQSLGTTDKTTVISRMPNMAFLQPGERPGSVSFEHELFFDYFLSSRAADSLVKNSPSLTFMLSRAAMPDSLSSGVANMVSSTMGFSLHACIEHLNSAANTLVSDQEIVRENCGRLASELLMAASRVDAVDGLKIRGFSFPGSRMSNVKLRNSTFDSVQFRRVDFRGAKLVDCLASNCHFESVLLDKFTTLGLSGADPAHDFRGVRLAERDVIRSIFDPKEILAVLREVELPEASKSKEPEFRKVDASVIQTISEYVKASLRMNPLCVSENPFDFHPDRALWAQVTRIGEEAGVFRTEFRGARGPRMPFVRRLFRGEDIIGGIAIGSAVQPEIEKFWTDLERQFPKKK